MSRTTDSVLELASRALDAARMVLPDHAHRFSPKKFTQPQLVAILAVRQQMNWTFRATATRLDEWSDLLDSTVAQATQRGLVTPHDPHAPRDRLRLETCFPMDKRKFGPSLRGRSHATQQREGVFRQIILNLMLEPPTPPPAPDG